MSFRRGLPGSLLVVALVSWWVAPALAADCSIANGLTMPFGVGSLSLGGNMASGFLGDVADRWNLACATATGGRFPALSVS